MNSIAQHAVPNGIGQSEFDCAHWTATSSFVVRKSAPEVEGIPGPSGVKTGDPERERQGREGGERGGLALPLPYRTGREIGEGAEDDRTAHGVSARERIAHRVENGRLQVGTLSHEMKLQQLIEKSAAEGSDREICRPAKSAARDQDGEHGGDER